MDLSTETRSHKKKNDWHSLYSRFSVVNRLAYFPCNNST